MKLIISFSNQMKIFSVILLSLTTVSGFTQPGCDSGYHTWMNLALDKSTAEARKICAAECNKGTLAHDFFFAYSYFLDEEPDSALAFILPLKKKYASDSLYFLEALTRRIWDDTSETRKSKECIEHAIKLQPDNAYYLSEYAEVLLELGYAGNMVVEVYDKCLQADNEYVPCYLGKAGVLMAGEQPEEAKKLVYKAISLEPDNPSVYLYASRVMNQGDLWLEGMHFLDTALAFDSSYVEAYIEKADMYMAVEEPVNAIVNYDQALFFDAEAYDIYLMRGDALLDIQEYDLAIRDYKTYLKFDPRSPDAVGGLADAYYDRGMFDSALVQYQLLPPGFDNDPDVAFGKARCYQEMGNFDEAFKLYNGILGKEPNNIDVYLERGMMYMEQKKYYEAEKDFKYALKIDPTQVDVFYLHCQAAYYAGFENDACVSCKQAIFYGVKDVDKKFLKPCSK